MLVYVLSAVRGRERCSLPVHAPHETAEAGLKEGIPDVAPDGEIKKPESGGWCSDAGDGVIGLLLDGQGDTLVVFVKVFTLSLLADLWRTGVAFIDGLLVGGRGEFVQGVAAGQSEPASVDACQSSETDHLRQSALLFLGAHSPPQ